MQNEAEQHSANGVRGIWEWIKGRLLTGALEIFFFKTGNTLRKNNFMNLRIRIICLCLLASICLAMQSPGADAKGAKGKDEKTEEAIRKIEMDVRDWLLKGDIKKIEKVMAENFVNISEEGETQDREEMLNDLKAGTIKVTKFEISKMAVHPFGDVAIAIYFVEIEAQVEGKAVSVKNSISDIFHRVDGEWKWISSHSAKL